MVAPSRTHIVWRVVAAHSCAVEEESHSLQLLALTLAEGSHQLIEAGRLLDLEEDFVVAVGDFDVEVLATGRSLGRGAVGGLLLVGHVDEDVGIKTLSHLL